MADRQVYAGTMTVRELSGRGVEVLSGTDGSVVGEDALVGAPAGSYLGRDEPAAYALIARRGEVTVEREDGTETYSPGRGCRTVTITTPVRVLVAVGGGADGDDYVASIPTATITGAEVDEGLLSGTFVVETTNGRWSIPCRGDLDPVVAYLDAASRAWVMASEFTDDVDVYLDRARTVLDEGDPETALSAVVEAEELLDRAETRLSGLDVGPAVATGAGLDARRGTVRRLRRRVEVAVGDLVRERAVERQSEGAHETAHVAVERAMEAYRRAVDTDGPRPPGDAIEDRLARLDWLADDLARSPLADATAAYAAVDGRVTPTGRAAALSEALDRYRDLLGLCWGPNAAFVGDSDGVRERSEAIVEQLVGTRIRLARRALAAADRFSARGASDPGLAACDVADGHLRRARDVATELAPGLIGTVDAWAGGVDEQRERLASPAAVTASGTATAVPTDGGATADGRPSDDDDGATAGITMSGGKDVPETDREALAAKLRALDQTAFTTFVARLWDELGWGTTVFAASVDQYDVVAFRRDPVDLKVLLWAVQSPDRDLDAAIVDRAAADRAQVDDADAVALVTTADLPESVRDRAETNNVKLLGLPDLLDRLADRDPAALLDWDN